ncbi:FliI/YscN family ATPase [bacterium]|nr:FliI/YscN family ATPase [bacterium]
MSRALYEQAIDTVEHFEPLHREGTVRRVAGLIVEAVCPPVFIGERCRLSGGRLSAPVDCEVVGVREDRAQLMPYEYTDNISVGTRVECSGKGFELPLSEGLLGRVIDALGRPVDGLGDLPPGELRGCSADAPPPLERPEIDESISSGVRAIDACLTWGKGQRLGVFAGSGVGKSTLFGMIARNSDADVNVIGLIGERGREVKEFITRDLGEEGLRRSVVVAVPSNDSPLKRVKGSEVAFAIAEYFRDRGKNVLLMVDSLTRYAYAIREIGLSLGEPPTTRGYTPSVYAMIPRLCERAGVTSKGSITALMTILVEGDDMNEPVADIARSVLDGHIALSRKLGSEGHYPPIDVLESVSRVMRAVTAPEHYSWSQWLRGVLATYREAEDLINIGAYTIGNNPRIDRAIRAIEDVRAFLKQDTYSPSSYTETLGALRNLYEQHQNG